MAESRITKVDQVAPLYYRLVKNLISSIIIAAIVALLIGSLAYLVTQPQIYYLQFFLAVLFVKFIWGIITSYLTVKNLGYMISDNSVSFRSGVLSLSTDNIPFSTISDSNFSQGILQRIFSVGDLYIEQEDEDEFVFGGIDLKTGHAIMEIISKKSNAQPINISK